MPSFSVPSTTQYCPVGLGIFLPITISLWFSKVKFSSSLFVGVCCVYIQVISCSIFVSFAEMTSQLKRHQLYLLGIGILLHNCISTEMRENVAPTAADSCVKLCLHSPVLFMDVFVSSAQEIRKVLLSMHWCRMYVSSWGICLQVTGLWWTHVKCFVEYFLLALSHGFPMSINSLLV